MSARVIARLLTLRASDRDQIFSLSNKPEQLEVNYMPLYSEMTIWYGQLGQLA